MTAQRVVVVGAGVVGLTCAVRLLETGHRVDVLARDLPRETTSRVAAALWYPYRALPQERVTGWAATSYGVFSDLAAVTSTGVRMLPGLEVYAEEQPEPWWASAVPDLRRAQAPGFAGGWSFTAPVVDMPVYLDWLVSRVEAMGGTITRLNLRALPVGDAIVVNCSGIGARLLAADLTVTPVSGQVVHLSGVTLERWALEGSGPTYVVPRTNGIVVGGTSIEDEWSRTPDPAVTAHIVARATRLVPELATARVVRAEVGLRPARPRVRLERSGSIVHCYGHGGAGVTLSWGCADEVAELLS